MQLFKQRPFNKIIFLATFVFLLSFGISYASSYERYAPGGTAVIGEFVYDDNFVATTTAGCTVTIYNSSGLRVVNAGAMTATTTGWYSYNYSIPITGPEGLWPTEMTCGSVPSGDLVKMDKSFTVGAEVVSSSTIADAVWDNPTRTLTSSALDTGSLSTQADVQNASSSIISSITGLPALVWSYSTKTLSSFGTLAADVWAIGTRTLTGAGLNSGSLATLSDVESASTTIGALIASLPSSVWNYSSRTLTSIASVAADVWAVPTRTLTSIASLASDVWSSPTRTLTSLTLSSQSPWTVSVSDFGTIVAGSTYRATVTTVYNGTLTDSANLPVITIYDPSRNLAVNAVNTTRTATGTYEYAYSTAPSAEAGVWEAVVSATVETGKTLLGNDYWNVTNSPAQVIVNSITDDSVPSIAANVTITNEGLSGYEYQYEWCVVSSVNNSCGGGDDVFHGIAAKYINPGEDFNTSLTATVPTAGNYYFKLVVYFGTESSGASRSFTAVSSGSSGGNNTGGGSTPSGGGGSSGGSDTPVPVVVGTCRRADFNCDGKVNSVDFSVLLYYWKAKPPFRNVYVDINKDNKIESVDFSILLYEWGKK